MMPDAARTQRIREAFTGLYGAAPLVWTRAPGRVDLMGSHTDYNLGYVLTLPISRDLLIAARPSGDGQVRVHSLDLDSGARFPLSAIERDDRQPWTNYVRGVAAVFASAGFPVRGFDAVIQGTVPIGSGLSSSAALECATAMLLSHLGGWTVPPVEMALLCQRAENQFVGVNCGILDQYTSCCGRPGCALLLDCRDLSHRSSPVHPSVSIVICDTRAERTLAASAYGARRAQCEEGARILGVAALRHATPGMIDRLPPAIAPRCRFIVGENQRVIEMAQAIESGDAAAVGALCSASYRGARDLYEISCPAMEAMIEAMTASPGVLGARQAGAGFGGCMVAFVESSAVSGFAAGVQQRYAQLTGVEPYVYPVDAAAGAEVLQLR